MKPLSPTRYIKTKARSLPLYKCVANANWKSSAMANRFVSIVQLELSDEMQKVFEAGEKADPAPGRAEPVSI